MKILRISVICLCINSSVFAQIKTSKPVIDSNAVVNWVGLLDEKPLVSNDGNYFSYGIGNSVTGARTLIIQSTKNAWKKEFTGLEGGFFSGDSKQFIYKSGDTLLFQDLGSGNIKTILHVSSFKQIPVSKDMRIRDGEWLAWQLSTEGKDLVLYNLLTGKERMFSYVSDYSFDEMGNKLLVKTEIKRSDSAADVSLKILEFPGGEPITIWNNRDGFSFGSYSIGPKGDEIVLNVTEKKGDEQANSIWYYKDGMGKAIEICNNQTVGIEPGLTLDNNAQFNRFNDHYISFSLKEPENPKMPPGAESIDVWSYKDLLRQSIQLVRREDIESYQAIMDVNGDRVVRIQRKFENGNASITEGRDFAVVKFDDSGDQFWLKGHQKTWLVSYKDGSRKEINASASSQFNFSPDGRYLIYYRDDNYYSYDPKGGIEVNISQSIPAKSLSVTGDIFTERIISMPVGLAGWMSENEKLIVYDNYDIWQLDPAGKTSPVNLTGGFGKLNHIKLKIVEEQEEDKKLIQSEGPLLLWAFNTINKYNGFYLLTIKGKGKPEILTMRASCIYRNRSGADITGMFDEGMIPLKAQETNIWIIKQSSAMESPNYFKTSDFKTYEKLTDFNPEKKYNWLTTELITYPQLDGTISQGILYKPENFDSNKRYPLIIQFYEQFSNSLYEFPAPDFCRGRINIPWFVSRGYLVFTPDMHYTTVPYGPSVVNGVEGAGKYFSKLPYVDGKKMGFIGHSWGGSESNYLVTHSHIFAAALTGAGGGSAVDWISNSLLSDLNTFEAEQGGKTIWERPDSWVKSSPVMSADKVTTPLLIFHNINDDGHFTTWYRAVEFFVALRRLGKKTWLLQYDNGYHTVNGKDAEDYTTRVQQFFDHYLKGAPPPVWMTRGIPAKLKGIETGLELDDSGKQP